VKIKTWQIAVVLCLSVLVPPTALMISRTTKAQTPQTADIKPEKKEEGVCKGHHRSKKDFYASVRMFPPVTVLDIEANRINYSITEEGIELGSVELESNYSVVPKDFSREHHSGCYGITYCERHKVVLMIDNLPQNFCQTVKQ
jgi:hypothetical protein